MKGPQSLFLGESMSTKSISPGVHDAWKQATESMLDDLRREGIGYAASCRFVTSPLLDEGYPVYPKSAPKTLLPWYRGMTRGLGDKQHGTILCFEELLLRHYSVVPREYAETAIQMIKPSGGISEKKCLTVMAASARIGEEG